MIITMPLRLIREEAAELVTVTLELIKATKGQILML